MGYFADIPEKRRQFTPGWWLLVNQICANLGKGKT